MESMTYDSTIGLPQVTHADKGVMGSAGNLWVVHAVDVNTVDAVLRKVADLLARVLDTRTGLGGGVISRTDKALHHLGWDGRAAVKRHALNLFDTREGHDPGNNGKLDPIAQALLAEAVEVVVVEEKLGYQEVRSRLLLYTQSAHGLVKRGRLHVALGIASGTDAQRGGRLVEVCYQVGGMGEVDYIYARPTVTSKREHVLDSRRAKAVHVGVDIGSSCPHAGEVSQRGDPKVALNPGGNGYGIGGVSRTSRRIRNRNPVWLVFCDLGSYSIRLFERHFSLGRKYLKRERLPSRKLVGNLHGSPIAQK